MAKLTLKRLRYVRCGGDLVASDAPLAEVHDLLGAQIGKQIAVCLEGFPAADIAAHYLCSTIIDIPFASGALHWDSLRASISRHTDCAPETVVNAYECASWGFCLRHALGDSLATPYVVCTIVDINVFNLSFWKENPNWGHSGFGISTLLIECAPGASSDIEVGVAKTSNFIAEFAIAMRDMLHKRPGLKLAQPFFPQHVAALFSRLLPNKDQLPDLHPSYGHCFGADPWLSIMNDSTTTSLPGQRYLAASVALNGYWSLAEIAVDPNTQFSFTDRIR